MQLKVKDGKLTLGSVYKLFVVAWSTTWITMFGFIFFILIITTLITGDMTVNGELISGRGPAMIALSPMLILSLIVVFLQSFFFAAFLTGGVWLYRHKRPSVVIIEG